MSQPGHPEEDNPYSPPREEPPVAEENLLFPFEADSPETLRSTYGAHEASVRTIGLYLYLTAVMAMLSMVLVLASPQYAQEIANRAGRGANVPSVFLKIVVVSSSLFAFGLNFVLGFFLRRLHNWARWVVVVLSGFGILGVLMSLAMVGSQLELEMIAMAVGLVFLIYIIIILLTSNVGVVLSERYRRVIARTPELSPRPSVRDWVFLGTAAAYHLGSLLIQIGRALS